MSRIGSGWSESFQQAQGQGCPRLSGTRPGVMRKTARDNGPECEKQIEEGVCV